MANISTSYTVLNSKEVTSFLTDTIQPIASVKSPTRKDNIEAAIQKLSAMASQSEAKETEAYRLFGVKDLKQLQQKLDELNANGLLNLSNKALRTFPAIKRAKGSYGTKSVRKEKLTSIINNEFKSYLLSRLSKDALKFSGLDEETILNLFKHFLGEKGVKFSGGATVVRHKRGNGYLKLAFDDFVKKNKKQLEGIFVEANEQTSSSDELVETTLIITGQVEENMDENFTLNFYPYFSLTPEEKKEAEKDMALWHRFVKAVGRCTNGVGSMVEEAMQQMGIKAFINAGGSYADIVGIFGELQGLVLLRSFNCSQRVAKFLGHDTNEKNQKIGIDLAFEGIGFQVKNYYSYGTRGQDEGINLRGSYKLGNFLDIVTRDSPLSRFKEEIEMFYAMSAFHVAVHKDFQPVVHWMDVVKTQNLPNLYNAAISEILPVKQITWINEEGEQLGQNYFYLIGGTRILPVSFILKLYIKFLQDLKNNLYNRRLISSSISKYTGETYKDYFKNSEDFNFAGYDSISDSLTMNYTINMNIDYALDQVLSRIHGEGIEV